MESLETRIKRLELITENHDERIMEHDGKFRQMWPVVVHAARKNLLGWITLLIAIGSVVAQLLKNNN